MKITALKGLKFGAADKLIKCLITIITPYKNDTAIYKYIWIKKHCAL